jgi:hypothetical protein
MKERIQSIDMVRGQIMIIMKLDQALRWGPNRLVTSTPPFRPSLHTRAN